MNTAAFYTINGKPSICLDRFVDSRSLSLLHAPISAAIAKNSAHIFPSMAGGKDNAWGPQWDGSELQGLLYEVAGNSDYRYASLLAQLDRTQQRVFLKFVEETQGIGHCLPLISPKRKIGYLGKDRGANCDVMPWATDFEPIFQWLAAQDVFDDFGRVIIFINDEGTGCREHRDYPPSVGTRRDQFLWISLDNRKRFYVLNAASGQKHYLTGIVSTFDNANIHGSETNPFATWSLRVDGKFSASFLHKTGLASHFEST